MCSFDTLFSEIIWRWHLKYIFQKNYLCLLLNVEFIDRNSQFFCLFSFHPALGAKERHALPTVSSAESIFPIQPTKVPCSEAPGQVCRPNPAPSLFRGQAFSPILLRHHGNPSLDYWGQLFPWEPECWLQGTVTGPDSCSHLICNLWSFSTARLALLYEKRYSQNVLCLAFLGVGPGWNFLGYLITVAWRFISCQEYRLLFGEFLW